MRIHQPPGPVRLFVGQVVLVLAIIPVVVMCGSVWVVVKLFGLDEEQLCTCGTRARPFRQDLGRAYCEGCGKFMLNKEVR